MTPTYRAAGVDLEAAERAMARIGPVVTSTWNEGVAGSFGGFAAGVRIPAGYRRPLLMLTTDGVGTKAELARRAGRLEGLGTDLVAMCVDDLAAVGAMALAMTDYLAVGRLDEEAVATLVGSVAAACSEAGVALIGGETAEHPGVLDPDAFDLAGTALGVVEEGRQIDGHAITAGDAVIGLASPNLRSNGFSLVRRVLQDRLGLDEPFPGDHRTTAEVLLEPSLIYAPAVTALVAAADVHGLAHVTGGGLAANLSRVLPPGCHAEIDARSWEPPDLFDVIARLGPVDRDEMFRTFNMGVGFVAVVDAGAADAAVDALAGAGRAATIIGQVREGERGVTLH